MTKYTKKQIEKLAISTHTPLAGRDKAGLQSCGTYSIFQLTRPSRGVTEENMEMADKEIISTHTPLAGRD